MKLSGFTTTVIVLGSIIAGLILVILSQGSWEIYGIDVDKVLSDLGTFLLFVGIFNFIYDVFTKKLVYEEIAEKVIGANAVAKSGIEDYHLDSRSIHYADEIESANSLRTLFAYSSGFLDQYEVQILRFLNAGGKAKLIFLRQKSPTIGVMRRLGRRDKSISNHYEKIKLFESRLSPEQKKNCSIVFVDILPRYSAVQVDDSIMVIFNTCSSKKQSVPAIRVSKNSDLWKFFNHDLDAVEVGVA